MKVLAIGATGFIGSHTVRRLVVRGHDVTVLHRGETRGDLPARVARMHADREALGEARPAIERLAPEVVLDVVPYTERQARELVDALAGVAGRVVVLSSVDVYRNFDGLYKRTDAPPDAVPLAEDAPLRERLHPYRGMEMSFKHRDDYDKILVERVVMGRAGLPGTVLRLPAVYGPGDRKYRLRPYLRRMVDGRSAILLEEGQARWSWTRGYVEDVAAAIALAVTEPRAAGRIYNVGEAEIAFERAWIERIGRTIGWTGEVVAMPGERLPVSMRSSYDWRYDLVADTRRLREELGFREPTAPDDTLARSIEWERPRVNEGEQPDYAAEDDALAAHRAAGRGG